MTSNSLHFCIRRDATLLRKQLQPALHARKARCAVAVFVLGILETTLFCLPALSDDNIAVVGPSPSAYAASKNCDELQEPTPAAKLSDASDPDDQVTVLGHRFNPDTCPLPPDETPIFPKGPRDPNQECVESCWYERTDYYQWSTRDSGFGTTERDRDYGALFTLGYTHAFGRHRLRLEAFGSDVHYQEVEMDANSHSGIFGGRGEYSFSWDTDVDGIPLKCSAGIGTRAWNRNIHAATSDAYGDIPGYSQTWWTVYPYFEVEKKWPCGLGYQFFVNARVGCNLFNYLYTSHYHGLIDGSMVYYDNPETLGPNPDLLGRVELGIQRNHISLSATFEVMSWQQSDVTHVHGGAGTEGIRSFASDYIATGLQLGFYY
jgi:hypothetical protein